VWVGAPRLRRPECGAGLAISAFAALSNPGAFDSAERQAPPPRCFRSLGISKGFFAIKVKGKYIMKKIVATLLLAGLFASAVMAEAKLTSGKGVHNLAATAAPTTVKKHKKSRKHRKTMTKSSPAKPKK